MIEAHATPVTHCRGCTRPLSSRPMFDLGEQYLSDFGETPEFRPPKAPLTLLQCDGCSLVQLSATVARSQMYHDNYGYRSGVNQGIRDNLQQVVKQGLEYHPDGDGRSWLDIASNDGTLLSFVPTNWVRVGVDPVRVFAPQARAHANRIIADYFRAWDFLRPSRGAYEQFDVITSISMFYDLHEPASFVNQVSRVLAPHGVWIIQQNYLQDMLRDGAFDNVCHEHLTYFSLKSLEAVLQPAGLQVIRVDRDPINGGCIRTVVARRGEFPVDTSVQMLRLQEVQPTQQDWTALNNRLADTVYQIRTWVQRYRDQQRPVFIYGASTRGSVIWQAAGLTRTDVTAAVEAQDQKVGRFYSAVDGIPIISEQTMRAIHRVGLVLVGPYWHREMFVERERDYMKRGGVLLFPLPQVSVVTGEAT